MSAAAKRFALTATALAASLTLGGCVVFMGTPKGKKVDSTTVSLVFEVCATGGSGGTCPDRGNSDSQSNNDDTNVLLIGLRVPEGSKLPRSIKPVRSDHDGKVVRSRQFSRVLNNEAPTPVGFKWTGYRSPPVVTFQEDSAKFRVRVGLPKGFDQRRVKLRPTLGYFLPDEEYPADSPIVCGDALFDRINDEHGDRTCIDSPTPDESAKHISVPLR